MVLSESVMVPPAENKGPLYSVTRLGLKGASSMVAWPMMVLLEVLELMVTLVVHSVAGEKPKRFADSVVLPMEVDGTLIVVVKLLLVSAIAPVM